MVSIDTEVKVYLFIIVDLIILLNFINFGIALNAIATFSKKKIPKKEGIWVDIPKRKAYEIIR